MLVSPCVPVLVLARERYGVNVRFAKNRRFFVVILILVDMTLGLGTEGRLEYGECCGGGRHERDDDDSSGCFKGCLCLSRGDRCASGECGMSLEADLLIKKGWVERTEAAKSSVDIDRGWVNSEQNGSTWGSNVQRSIAVFECLSVSFSSCQKTYKLIKDRM